MNVRPPKSWGFGFSLVSLSSLHLYTARLLVGCCYVLLLRLLFLLLAICCCGCKEQSHLGRRCGTCSRAAFDLPGSMIATSQKSRLSLDRDEIFSRAIWLHLNLLYILFAMWGVFLGCEKMVWPSASFRCCKTPKISENDVTPRAFENLKTKTLQSNHPNRSNPIHRRVGLRPSRALSGCVSMPESKPRSKPISILKHRSHTLGVRRCASMETADKSRYLGAYQRTSNFGRVFAWLIPLFLWGCVSWKSTKPLDVRWFCWSEFRGFFVQKHTAHGHTIDIELHQQNPLSAPPWVRHFKDFDQQFPPQTQHYLVLSGESHPRPLGFFSICLQGQS